MLWPNILSRNLEITFAHRSFKWSNQAKANAGVTVIIIGLSTPAHSKTLYYLNQKHLVSHINPYLTEGPDLYLQNRTFPISPSLPNISAGTIPVMLLVYPCLIPRRRI